MIPRGRPVLDAVGAAGLIGVSPKTFANRVVKDPHFPAPVNPGRRKLLYDQAQVTAYRDRRELPALPEGEHPDDLLDEHDIAAARGVEYGTVRKERNCGRLMGWVDVCGIAHMRRAVLTAQLKQRPGKGVGGGRPPKVTDGGR